MTRFIAVAAILAVFGTALAAASAHARPAARRSESPPASPSATAPVPAPGTAREKMEYRPEEWSVPVADAGKSLDLLALFATASHFGGITVKIPGELQRIPLASLGLQNLESRGIELYLKEIEFRDLEFTREQTPLWMETHPVLPAVMRFSKLGASLEAKTKLGMIPLGATFHDGVLPFDFVFRKDGYDLGIMPDRRALETNLEKVHLQVGGALASGFVNTFFGRDVAKLVMKYGVGQTLKMKEGGLFGGSDAASFLKSRSDSPDTQAIVGLLDAVGGKKSSKR